MDNTIVEKLKKHELWTKTLGKEGERLVLQEVDMTGQNLSQMDLSESFLLDSNFSDALMCGVDLYGSNLGCSIFHRTDLRNFGIVKGDADYADFEGAILCDGNAFRACFSYANFKNADLSGVNFTRCMLDEVDFTGANINRCKFNRATLRGAKGMESTRFDWIEMGKIDNSQKLNREDGLRWLLAETKKT